MNEKRKRTPMKPITEAMRGWTEALSREIENWPGIAVKNAFGMRLVYRNNVVFAALPRTRALYREDAILVKFASESPALMRKIAAEKRFAAGTMEDRRTTKAKAGSQGRRWRLFLMREDADVHRAMEWIAQAYRLAGRKASTGE